MPARTLPLACLLLAGLALALAACDQPAPPAEAPAEQTVPALFDGFPASDARVGGTGWTWNPVPGMTCRDGSSTGFGLRRAPADASPAARRKLVLWLDRGGACYSAARCLRSPANFDAASFAERVDLIGSSGIFDDRPDNPFQDWNVVFVPYCTGDVYSGDTTDVVLPDTVELGAQQFVGYRTVGALLDVIRGQAARASQVALVGMGGAGFGVVGTYGLVADRLAPAPVYLFNDSGPLPADDAVLTDSLQLLWREVWNLDTSMPDGCGETCFQASGDGIEHVTPYYAGAYPDRGFALISHTEDGVNRFHFGYLNPGCVPGPLGCYAPAADFRAGLLTLRDELFAPYPNAVTYYTEGRGHTSLTTDDFYDRVTAGVPLNEWVRDVLDDVAGDVGPAPRD